MERIKSMGTRQIQEGTTDQTSTATTQILMIWSTSKILVGVYKKEKKIGKKMDGYDII